MKDSAITYSLDNEGIGSLIIDVPGQKVNTLSASVMLELGEWVEKIRNDLRVKALVITSGKKDNFIAGADVKEFTAIHDAAGAEKMSKRGQDVFNRLSSLTAPSIAVIDGSCMGGGLELALACTYRIVTDEDKTALALPEVNLGLIPGWGGTQRLPKIVGLLNSLDMILTGKTIPAAKAFKMGLADAVVPRAFIKEKVREFAISCTGKDREKQILERRGGNGIKSFILEKNPIGRCLVFRKSEKQVMEKTKGFYPAPLKALSVIKESYGKGMLEGLELEAKSISSLLESNISKNLIRVFLNSQEIKKNPGGPSGHIDRQIYSVAILGAGTMGGAIAWLFSKDNFLVRLKDVSWDAIGKGLASASNIYRQLIKIKKLKPNEMRNKLAKISGTTDYSGFKEVGLVVEAIVEDMKIKKQVLEEVEKNVAKDAIIASNTSALSITEMAKALQNPQRFIGMHFFNPVNRMPLVEVIPGKETSPDTIAICVNLLKNLGKTPIVVADQPGFLVNRILLPYLNEGAWLLEQGADFEKVDKLLVEFGMPMGPFQLLDEVGLDVAFKAAKTLEAAFGARAKVSSAIQMMVEEGIKGKKSGGGFYIEEKGKRHKNPQVERVIASKSFRKEQMLPSDIIDRCILGMVNEASRCLSDHVVENAVLLDMAIILGAGFPPFRGGLLAYADQQGMNEVVRRLQELSEIVNDRFTPSQYLLELKATGSTFYQR